MEKVKMWKYLDKGWRITVRKHTKNIDWFFAGLTVLFVLFASFVHGLLPYLPYNFGWSSYGAIECGAYNFLDLFQAKCSLFGGDTGHIYPLALPIIILGSIFNSVPMIDYVWAYSIVGIFILGLGMFGVFKLIREFKVTKYVALGGAFVYVMTPIVTGMHSFGGTYWGVLLLPFAIHVAWRLINLEMSINWKRALVTFGTWSILSVIMLFNDGYSFVMFTVASGIMLLIWSWKKWNKKEFWLTGMAFVFATLLAYLLYRATIPSADSWTSPLSQYRSSGLDLITLIYPFGKLWWAEILGFTGGIKGLWGDGANSAFNYVGISVLTLSVVGIYLFRKKLTKLGVALLVLACVSFVLSLGPSLKINSQRVSDSSENGFVSSSVYRMPESSAIMPLPTAHAYKLPGLKAMRATYRWHVVTMLVMIIFACRAIQYLINHKKHSLAYLLLAIMIIEFLPNPLKVAEGKISVWNKFSAFNTDVAEPLRHSLDNGDRVIFFPNARGDNDFLVNYLAPTTRAWTYNTGGDKALAHARLSYPESVTNLIKADGDTEIIAETSGQYIKEVFHKDYINKLVIPKFDLRWDSYTWPPRSGLAAEKAKVAAEVAREQGFRVAESEYYYLATKQE